MKSTILLVSIVHTRNELPFSQREFYTTHNKLKRMKREKYTVHHMIIKYKTLSEIKHDSKFGRTNKSKTLFRLDCFLTKKYTTYKEDIRLHIVKCTAVIYFVRVY